jgi:hypothetical protein
MPSSQPQINEFIRFAFTQPGCAAPYAVVPCPQARAQLLPDPEGGLLQSAEKEGSGIKMIEMRAADTYPRSFSFFMMPPSPFLAKIRQL